MKKYLFLFSFILGLAFPSVMSAEVKEKKVVDPYTGEEIGAFFEVGEDGKLHEKPVEELAKKLKESNKIEEEMKTTNSGKVLNSPKLENNAAVSSSSLYVDYKYDENYHYRVIGASKRVSNDVYCNNSSSACPISKAWRKTYTSSFSANIDTSLEKDAMKAGLGFAYNYSSTNSSTVGYTLYVDKGRVGYLAFYPYYEYSAGYLKKYVRGRYSSKQWSTAHIPKELSNGNAMGGWAIIYVD